MDDWSLNKCSHLSWSHPLFKKNLCIHRIQLDPLGEDFCENITYLNPIWGEITSARLPSNPSGHLWPATTKKTPPSWRIIPVRKWLVAPIYKPWNGRLEGKKTHLGDLLTTVIYQQLASWDDPPSVLRCFVEGRSCPVSVHGVSIQSHFWCSVAIFCTFECMSAWKLFGKSWVTLRGWQLKYLR